MKQLTMNEINEVSGGPIQFSWGSALIGWVTGHAYGVMDSMALRINDFMVAYAGSITMSYEECMDYVANLPNGSIE